VFDTREIRAEACGGVRLVLNRSRILRFRRGG